METCGGILTDHDQEPAVSLRGTLLTLADVPSGYRTTGPRTTTDDAHGIFYASVPSTVPVSFISFSSGADSPNSSTALTGIDEAVGQVESPQTAAEQAVRIQAASSQPSCLPSGKVVDVPGSVVGLRAVEGYGSNRAQSLTSATVVVARGPYVVDITWGLESTHGVTLQLPSPSQLGSLVNRALSHVPG